MKTYDPFSELTDEDLVKKITKSNNTIAYGILYDRYEKKVYNKCYGFAKSHDEALDLTQDVFLKLFTKLHTFKYQSKFSTWLYSFTYNFCVNFIQRDKEHKISAASSSFNIEELDDTYEEVDDTSLFEMKAEKLAKALNQINPEEKSILLLKYQDDVSILELTELLEISESAVKMRLKRTKSKLVEIYNLI